MENNPMSTRENVSRTTLIDTDGNKVASPLDAHGVKWEFYDLTAVAPEGAADDWKPPVIQTRAIMLDEVNEAAPDDIDTTRGFAIHGVKALGGESYSQRKKLGLDAWTMLDERFDTVKTGEWSEGRGDGVASSATLILLAIVAVLEGEGIEVTDDMRTRAASSVDTPEKRKSALERADIKAAYLKIAADRKAELARKAAERAAAAAAAEGHQTLAESLGLVAAE
jgi:hypothetical protein